MKTILRTLALAAYAALLAPLPAAADDSFYTAESSSDTAAAVEVSGSVTGIAQYFASPDSSGDSEWFARTEMEVDLAWKGELVELAAGITMEPEPFPDDIGARFDEAYARLYLGALDLQAGWISQEWGKGDSAHAVDVLNASDLRWFIDREDRSQRIPELMLKANVTIGGMGKLELAYLPFFTPDEYATSGAWAPWEARQNQAALSAAMTAWSTAYYTAILPTVGDNTIAGLLTEKEATARQSNLERKVDTRALEYGQGGLRFTTTTGPVDWGFMGFAGYLRDPIVQLVDVTGISAASDPHAEISYERAYMAGAEAAAVLAGFNLRAEGAVRLTKDLAGDDPVVKNGTAGWVLGFDRDLPLGVLNVNVQGKGEYVLMPAEADTAGDVDYAEHYSSTMLIARAEGKLLNETLAVSMTGIWEFESASYALRPQVAWTWRDIATLALSGRLYAGDEDSLFGQFDDSDSVQLSLEIKY
ncbi:MAG: hypothetical protein NT080_09635 [Spirochaetes bacterium]|nr:hypothetical protein [Spirochaetota bacterium]